MKKKEETGTHVRMLTHEIRSTLNRHTILKTTLVELSQTLKLKSCNIWMPTEGGEQFELTHELEEDSTQSTTRLTVSKTDPGIQYVGVYTAELHFNNQQPPLFRTIFPLKHTAAIYLMIDCMTDL